jgi:lipoyl(octanoyl) transferase
LQNKSIELDKQTVTYKDLGKVSYKDAWDYQEYLLQTNVKAKSLLMNRQKELTEAAAGNQETYVTLQQDFREMLLTDTKNHLLVCEHPPVYTLGKSGDSSNILISEEEMKMRQIEFYKTNRGGDITFHGPEQLVGYPILDLEKFYTDIGRYLRELEEVIILTIAEYGISGVRSKGETGVWIDAEKPGKERKICAMGVRCSRWITMHGFALNVNTDLSYFDNIIPCGIFNKQVTSIEKELHGKVDMNEVKEKVCRNFEQVFNVRLLM